MIIDSPIISGSSAASGSLNQFGNVTITGSLTVTGPITGVLTGSVNSASFATTASYVSPNTQINTASFAITASYVSPNTQINTSSFAITSSYARTVDFNNTVATSSFAVTASYVSPNTQINTASFAITASYVSPNTQINTASFAITASYVSPNTQINTASFAVTSSYATNAETLDGLDSSAFTSVSSFQNYTSSNDARIASINAFSASILNYTSSTDAKVNALYAFSSSLLSYTSSTDAKIASIYSTTASLNDSIASLNTYTSSNTMNVVTLFAASASLNANVAGLNAQTASLLSYTSSNNTTNTTQNTRLSALEAATASIYTTTASLNDSITSLNSYTSSNSANVATLFAASASLNASVSSLNSYTSSLNAKTASFATTGSNTLTGVQYVSNNSQATSFTSTASIYTDGGMRVTRDAYVSGTLYLNNLTVFGTQSISYISSSQLNISTNLITVNTDTPSIRFGGLAVYDSGSTGLTGSILWDSQENHWVYSNPSGSSYSGGMFISGPRSAALGSEQGTTNNALMKGQGGDHITSSGVFEVSGSVGIGTSSPGRILEVSGNGNDGTQVQIKGTLDSAGIKLIPSSGDNWEIQATNSSQFVVYNRTDSAHRLLIDSVGNVGIGTTTASSKLTVSSGGDAAYLTLNTTSSANKRSRIQFTQNNDSGLEIGTDYNVDNTANFYFYNRSLGGSAGFVITPGGNHYFPTGNVGIGSTDPAYKLDVSGTGRFTGAVQISGQQAAANYGGTGLNFDFTSGNISRIASVKTTSGGSQLQFFVYNTSGTDINALQITSTGNVGIGTTTPSDKLSVSGSISSISGNLHTNRGRVAFSNTSTDANHSIYNNYNNIDGEGIWDGMKFNVFNGASFRVGDSSAPTTALYINSSGNVGVGTTSPVGLFSITPASAATRKIVLFSGGNNDYQFYGFGVESSTLVYSTYTTSDDHVFFAGTGTGSRSELMRIKGNGSVGIGTSTPTAPLTVAGTTDLAWSAATSKLQISRSSTVARLQNYDNGSASPLALQWEGGNVGIGTTSPATKLTVYVGSGTISGTNDAIRLQVASYATTARNTIVWHQDGGDTILARYGLEWNSSTTHMNFVWRDVYANNATGSTELMRLQGNGNLGIGTSSPQGNLEVVGLSYFTRSSQSFLLNPNYGGSGTHAQLQVVGNMALAFATNGDNERMRITSGGNVGIGTTSPSSLLDVRGRQFVGGGTSTYIPTSGSSLIAREAGDTFIGVHDSGYGVMLMGWDRSEDRGTIAVDSGQDIVFITDMATTDGADNLSGKTPKVTIKDTGNGTLLVGGTSAHYSTSNRGTIEVNGTSHSILALKVGGTPYGYLYTDGTLYLANPSANSIALQTGASPTTKMIISSDGNVGIGTTSPSGRLHIAVDGAAIWSQYFTATNGANKRNSIGFYDSGNTNIAAILTDVNADGTADFGISVPNGSPRLVIKSNGNVGIGTTSPGTRLHIFSTADSYRAIRIQASGSTGDAGIEFIGAGGNTFNIQQPGSSAGLFFYDRTNSATRMYINADGNVGIGTTSPVATFEVISSGRLAKIGTGIVFTSTNTAQAWMGSENWGWTGAAWSRTANSAAVIWGTGNNNGAFEVWTALTSDASTTAPVNSNSRFMVSNGGNVGIGTTSPIYKLDTYYNTNAAGVMQVRNVSAGGAAHAGMYIGNNDVTNGAGMVLFGSGYSSSGQYRANGNYIYSNQAGGLTLSAEGAASLYLATNNSLRLLINSSGDIGIGTTSPNVTGFGGARVITVQASIQPILELIGSTYNSTGVFGGGAVHFRNTSTSVGTVGVENLTGNQGNMVFYTNNGSTWAERMRIASDGNVGIGTTGPGSKLTIYEGDIRLYKNHVNGNSATWLANINFTDEVDRLGARITGERTAWDGAPMGLGFDTGGVGSVSRRMTITSGGNVGISTTSPSTALHVHKDGANGSGGLGDFGIVATSTASGGTYQATIGAMNIEAGGYANLNLGDSDGINGTRYFWHISKRLPASTDLGAGGRNLSYYWYNGSGFAIQFAFSTGGSFYAAADVVAYASSDIRLKDNVVKIESPLEKLIKLNGYTFTWNDKQTTYEAGKKDLGVIAQEVEKVFPEIVKDRENGTKGVMYDKLVPVLIEAIKEQQQQIDELKYLLQTINK